MSDFKLQQAERVACIEAICRSCRLGIPHATDERGTVWDLHDNTDPRQPCYHQCPAGPLWKREELASKQHDLLVQYRYGVSGSIH